MFCFVIRKERTFLFYLIFFLFHAKWKKRNCVLVTRAREHQPDATGRGLFVEMIEGDCAHVASDVKGVQIIFGGAKYLLLCVCVC